MGAVTGGLLSLNLLNDERPSRLDFAKERFGGPFSTEQVEDVKILFRIVLILLAVGPVFSMDPLFDHLSLAVIALHVGSNRSLEQCPWEMFVTNAGTL
jgi:peptide/histidine transporter 3/4